MAGFNIDATSPVLGVAVGSGSGASRRTSRASSSTAATATLLDASVSKALPGTPPRTIGVFGIAFMAYMAVCAGPYGIEDAVQSGGPFPVILACFILPIFWGLPQALITAELSTLCDENGGYVLWVRRGLGNFAGWMSSYNSLFSNLTDLPCYAVLFADYIQVYIARAGGGQLSGIQSWFVKLVSLALILLLNLRGVGSVAVVSFLITVFIMMPFFIEPFMAGAYIQPSEWLAVAPSMDLPTFVATCLWLWQGWDGLGCVAGEVANGKRSYPLGITLALLLMLLTYVVPVAIGINVIPDISSWVSGELEVAAGKIAPWLGIWVALGAMISEVGNFNVIMCNSARALWAMARRKMVPPQLAWSWERFQTPAAAILFHGLTTALLMNFSFSTLVVVDTFFNNLSLVLEGAAFLALRHRDPHAPRPFKVPGGLMGAWAVTIPKMAVILFGLVSGGLHAWLVCGAFNVLFVLGYLLRNRLVGEDDESNHMDNVEPTAAADALTITPRWHPHEPEHMPNGAVALPGRVSDVEFIYGDAHAV